MNHEEQAHNNEKTTMDQQSELNSLPNSSQTQQDQQASQKQLPAEEVECQALQWKEAGNTHYQKKEFAKAAEAYQSGLFCLQRQTSTPPVNSTLAVALRSNLAQVLLKLEKYKLADVECSQILQVDPKNAKVLYRRALAREGTAFCCQNKLTVAEQQTCLSEAMEDLKLCFSILEEKPDASSELERQRMKAASQSAFDRLTQTYASLNSSDNNDAENAATSKKLQPLQPDVHSSAAATVSAGSTQEEVDSGSQEQQKQQPPRLTKAQQKKDVIRLLLSRQMTANNNNEAPKGEAFFLLEWNWWCRWCRHVDFFYSKDLDNNSQDPASLERVAHVLKLMPPGAVFPTEPNNNNGDIGSSDDSDSEDEPEDGAPPGVIDNSRLLFGPVPHVLFRQWYDTTSLLPNLVRGYHYELLPREVYCALRSWYGEVTPSLCRRTTDNGDVVLYPQKPLHPEDQQPPLNTQKCSACRAPRATARCKRCLSVHYCDRSCQESHWPYHKILCKTNNNKNGLDTQQSSFDKNAGRIGLNNLGNTCFMNSALQCLSHVTPLTRHFLSNKFKADVNASNPLGTGGKLAYAYDVVMKDLWMKHTTGKASTSPTALKRAIALFAPRFAGCLQHDAQEFLAYLLDGLHEDLNRIRKAPYVEMPDVTDGQNMAIAGSEAWDAHRRRNNSLVMDTVYGQFKSTCVCPRCERISVSFDAFNHVSLEIPQTHNLTLTIPIVVFRAPRTSGDKKPLRYGVSVRRQSLVSDLRRGLSELTGIQTSRLILCDLYENSIYELLHDKKSVSSFRANDLLAAYEVEPYTSSSIHAVVTHSILEYTAPHVANGADGADDAAVGQLKLFGFPFMTSFNADSTCKQVWDHMWTIVDYMVEDKDAVTGFVDKDSKYRREDVLQVRIVDSHGKPLAVFYNKDGSEEKNSDDDDGSKTSVLPFTSNERVRDCLDKDCTENFLFLSLQWRNPNNHKEDSDTNKASSLIQPDRFVAYADHPSMIEAIKKQRARNGQKGVTLDQCFETFTKPERLDEHNMWYCSKCKEHVRALKTMKLWRLPNVLVVHLKRFEFKHALRRDKLDTYVDFPLDGLDMGPHCADWTAADANNHSFVKSFVPAEYDLFAVVNHYGRMGFGHYTAYARKWDETGTAKDWALFDDSSVRSIGEGKGAETVVTPAAYVLFYRRRTFN